MKKPDVAGVLGALALGEQEAEVRHQARKANVEPKETPKVGRPRTDRQQFTITLSPRAVEIVEQELLTRMKDKTLKPSERRPGPTIEALILEAARGRKS